jgi:heme/copper-type cytochrome/quinol oxidase subunit 4
MTALGFILTVIAFAMALFESGKNREPFPGTAVMFVLGLVLMLLGVTVFLWKHMP